MGGYRCSARTKPASDVSGDLFDIRLELETGEATVCGLEVRGTEIRCEVLENALHCLGLVMPIEISDGRIDLRVLVDRVSLEIFANRGRTTLTTCFLPKLEEPPLRLFSLGSACRVITLDVHELHSAWTEE